MLFYVHVYAGPQNALSPPEGTLRRHREGNRGRFLRHHRRLRGGREDVQK